MWKHCQSVRNWKSFLTQISPTCVKSVPVSTQLGEFSYTNISNLCENIASQYVTGRVFLHRYLQPVWKHCQSVRNWESFLTQISPTCVKSVPVSTQLGEFSYTDISNLCEISASQYATGRVFLHRYLQPVWSQCQSVRNWESFLKQISPTCVKSVPVSTQLGEFSYTDISNLCEISPNQYATVRVFLHRYLQPVWNQCESVRNWESFLTQISPTCVKSVPVSTQLGEFSYTDISILCEISASQYATRRVFLHRYLQPVWNQCQSVRNWESFLTQISPT